jgi:hypothetical protein
VPLEIIVEEERGQTVKKIDLLERFLATKPAARGEIRDEVVEMVGRAGIFDVSDLIAVMKAGYKTLPCREKNEFMRRMLFELKKTEHP